MMKSVAALEKGGGGGGESAPRLSVPANGRRGQTGGSVQENKRFK